jgi:hypothetical protein
MNQANERHFEEGAKVKTIIDENGKTGE